MTHPFFASSLPRVFAHRGLVDVQSARSGVVDNTIAAFALAHANGVRYIETDARATSDGVAVLVHDETLDRTVGDGRRVDQLSAQALEEILATRGGLATLSDALDAFPTLRFNVDVKSDDAIEPVARVAAVHSERMLITSFSDARRRTTMRRVHELIAERTSARTTSSAPTAPAASAGGGTVARFVLAALVPPGPWSRALDRRILRDVDALQVPERAGILRVVTRRFVRRAHRAGTEVHVWTVDDVDDMRRLVALGVDGIVSDRADRAIAMFPASPH